MGAALVFGGHKLHVAVAEGWIRGRRHTVAAADDPSFFVSMSRRTRTSRSSSME
jgi:hypothetical protein